MADPVTFDIRDVDVVVAGRALADLADDGFGMTPEFEHTRITGLKGEVGFNRDPSSAANGQIVLRVTSPDNVYLREIINEQKAGTRGPVSISITVKPESVGAYQFQKIQIPFAMFDRNAGFETDGKSAPGRTYPFKGYAYSIE